MSLTIEILAVHRLKKGPLFDLLQDYAKQIKWGFKIHEIESKYREPKTVFDDENRRLAELINPNAFVVVMDERGNGLRSLDFAKTIGSLQDNGERHIQFVIGGADGLSESMRGRANLLLSFGQQTWPHMLARVMLVEQLYRAQQILAGHPYHRE